jgi:hypothetical protein
MDTAKFLRQSARIDTDDLDWDAARRAGLRGDEPFAIQFLADVEGQTVFYLREVLNSSASRHPDVLAFITTWNYEEFFHAESLHQLLHECGHPVQADRRQHVRAGARVKATLENAVQVFLSRVAPEQFLGLYFAWGASQELLTACTYERIARTTANPVLAELARRIARQERRHFAWYWHGARDQLARSRAARILSAQMVDRFWSPVGSGVMTPAEQLRLMDCLYPGQVLDEVMAAVQARVVELPGLGGVTAPTRYARAIARKRAARRPEAAAPVTVPPSPEAVRLTG